MSETKPQNSNFIVQGGILAAAGIISRIIGFIYRIPLQNTIGDAGMGYYSAAFQIYSIMLIISSYSLPVAVSKLVAARAAKGQYRNARRFFHGALLFATLTGGATCLIVMFGADQLAGNIMSIGFEKAYALQTDLNLKSSEIIATYVYKKGLLDGDYGFSTAVGLFNTVINVILLITVNKVVAKMNDGKGL